MIVVATAVLTVGCTSLSTSASAFGLVHLGGFGLVHPGFGLVHPGFGLAHTNGGYRLGQLRGSLGGRRVGGWLSHDRYAHGGGSFYRSYAYRSAPFYGGGYGYVGQPYYGGGYDYGGQLNYGDYADGDRPYDGDYAYDDNHTKGSVRGHRSRRGAPEQ
ncbi:hypothetical protein AC630_06975 [Bradyrhizobium sp. AS23.2]|nr:hypothetical protein AC630_06975 [Bradyrhizobium sp. AS23.2]